MVTFKNLTKLAVVLGSFAAFSTSSADDTAADVNVRVVITDVKATDAPLYISIQSKEDYRSERSAGALIIKSQTGKVIDHLFKVPAGEYAISVWHDLDKDNSFSMDSQWRPIDGWGSSGPELSGDPTFEDVKVAVIQEGQVMEISMHYPAP